MIRSELAFKQQYDTESLYPVQINGTDIDWFQQLPNGICVVNEWKKDTLNHTPANIINTPQWNNIRLIAREDYYAIYSTHNEQVSGNLIPTDKLIVRYVELNKQSINFPEGITLQKYLNKIGSVGRYYIIVKYSNGVEEIAVVSPNEAENEKWSVSKEGYSSTTCTFATEEECINYIKKRYEKDFNQTYIYSIFYADSISSAKLIHRYTYEEIIGL